MRTTKHKAEVQHPAYLCAKASASLSRSVLELCSTISPTSLAEEPRDDGAKLNHQNLAP